MHVVASSMNKTNIYVGVWSLCLHNASWCIVHPRSRPIDEGDRYSAIKVCLNPLQQWPSGPAKRNLHVEEGILPTGGEKRNWDSIFLVTTRHTRHDSRKLCVYSLSVMLRVLQYTMIDLRLSRYGWQFFIFAMFRNLFQVVAWQTGKV